MKSVIRLVVVVTSMKAALNVMTGGTGGPVSSLKSVVPT